jgi:uncharacterized spore protein YtfJ
MEVDDMLKKVSEFIHDEVDTKTVVGEEFTLGRYTCKPVIRVGLGLGSGKGGSKKESIDGGGGAGAAVGIEPLGFLVAYEKDIKFIPTADKKGIVDMMTKVPDVLSKYFDMKRSSSDKS